MKRTVSVSLLFSASKISVNDFCEVLLFHMVLERNVVPVRVSFFLLPLK